MGHIYYFLEDVFPNQPHGFRILKTPKFLHYLFDGPDTDPNYNPLPEERTLPDTDGSDNEDNQRQRNGDQQQPGERESGPGPQQQLRQDIRPGQPADEQR